MENGIFTIRDFISIKRAVRMSRNEDLHLLEYFILY